MKIMHNVHCLRLASLLACATPAGASEVPTTTLIWQHTPAAPPARPEPREPASTQPVTGDLVNHARDRHRPLIERISQEFGIDPKLLDAMISVESNYQIQARSVKGAQGLMQVMPATGKRFGFDDLTSPENNLRAGASYLKWLLNQFDDNLELALAAYNAGEGAIYKHGGQVPPYPETQHYISKVLNRYQGLPSRQQQPGSRATSAETPSMVAKLLSLWLSSPSK